MTSRQGLASTVACGDHRASLEALRDVLAQSVEQVEPQDRAPLARQLTSVLVELRNLPVATEANPADEIKRKREARRARGAATAG